MSNVRAAIRAFPFFVQKGKMVSIFFPNVMEIGFSSLLLPIPFLFNLLRSNPCRVLVLFFVHPFFFFFNEKFSVHPRKGVMFLSSLLIPTAAVPGVHVPSKDWPLPPSAFPLLLAPRPSVLPHSKAGWIHLLCSHPYCAPPTPWAII